MERGARGQTTTPAWTLRPSVGLARSWCSAQVCGIDLEGESPLSVSSALFGLHMVDRRVGQQCW